MTAPRAPVDPPETHVATLLALGRMVVGVRRPTVDESWFVVLTGLAAGQNTVVRVDA